MIDYIAISIPLIAFWWANITGIPQKFRRAFQKDSLKPFDCTKCLSFWLSLFYQLYLGFTLNSIVVICLSSLASYLIYVLFKKLNIIIND